MEFNYKEIFEIYSKLKELLIEKNEVIINKDIDRLGQIDEEVVVISEQIGKMNLVEILPLFDENQKQEMKKLAQEIKHQEEKNEMLIKHSLEVIDGLFSGILNIVQKENNSYNSKGRNCTNREIYQVSSIVEEA